MRWPGLLLLCALAACGPDSALSVPLASLNPMNMFGAAASVQPDDVEEPDGPYLRLAQGRRASDARLISQQGERRMWRTRGGVVVATDGVRVVATAGLPTMVAATRFDGPDPVAEPQSLVARSADARRVIDVMTASRDPGEMRFGIALNCRLSSAPSAEADTVIITETCRGEGMGVIRNRFWMDRDTSSIHTSEQWIGPRTAPLRISHNLEAAEAAPAAAAPATPLAAPALASVLVPVLAPAATHKTNPPPPGSPPDGSDAPAGPQ